MNRKTEFAWASIAGADPEPVELIEKDNRKGLYTIGCEDIFWLDDESAGIVVYDGNPLTRPSNPETQEQREAREAKFRAVERAKKAAYAWHSEHAQHGPDCDECGNTHGDAHSSNCTRGGTKK